MLGYGSSGEKNCLLVLTGNEPRFHLVQTRNLATRPTELLSRYALLYLSCIAHWQHWMSYRPMPTVRAWECVLLNK